MRIQTGSRLHFGILSLLAEEQDTSARFWGGAGLMVAHPGIEIIARSARKWQADGPLANRVLHFVSRFLSRVGSAHQPLPLHFTTLRSAPEHQGLGTGTQLALAVARLLAEAAKLPDRSAAHLAQLVGRGARSAIGIHGFEHGGFLVEAGKRDPDTISPLIARAEFPEPWRIVLIFLRDNVGLHGIEEKEALNRLGQHRNKNSSIDKLCRLLLLGMLPALHEADVRVFGESLHEFNRRVGEMFQSIQGGIYAHPLAEDIISFARKENAHGAGQSSWGPTLFIVTRDDQEAAHLAEQLCERFPLKPDDVIITSALAQGADLVREGPTQRAT